MALTLFVRVTATILDSNGVEANATAYALVDPSITAAQLDSYLASWLSALDGVTDGQITYAALTLLPALPGGLKSAPVAASTVIRAGTLNFFGATVAPRWGFLVPALSVSSTVTSGGKWVTTAGSPADVLIQLLKTPLTLIQWANYQRQGITAFVDSVISFRKRGDAT